MIVRHDTRALDRVMAASAASQEMPSRLAQAVEATVSTMVDGQAAAERTRAAGEAHARRWAGNGRFAVLAGAGVAVAAAGIGLGIWLARAPVRTPIAAVQMPLPPAAAEPSTLPPALADLTEPDTGPASPVVTNYAIFRETTVTLVGRDWVVNAGHHFNSAKDTVWSRAWCYINPTENGVVYSINLATRAAPENSAALGVLASELRGKLALDDATFDQLAAACPWLEAGGTAAATKV